MNALRLDQLLDGVVVPPPALAALAPRTMTLDSRKVTPGALFVALAGASTHGLRHVEGALARGAACVLFEPPAPGDIVLPAAALEVPRLRQHLGALADRFHGAPSAELTLVGVTGTNGKTSTVQLLVQALHASEAGPCGSIGTLGIGIGDEIASGERTTPDVVAVHAALADLRDRGARTVAMEVSSHALDQGRIDGVRFDLAVFSNLSRDHLDYHGTMDAYGATKARLFARPELAAAVINVDDDFGRGLVGRLPASLPAWTVSAAGRTDARLRAESVVLGAGGIGFDLCEGSVRRPVDSPLYGRFNVDNLVAVGGCLRALDWPLAKVAGALSRLQPVRGRMNRIAVDRPAPLVVVDYAHTPDALVQALASLRAHTSGRLICVFGCGGERDRGKRPQMAAAVERGADRVVLTDDNPRGEDGDRIVADALTGAADASKFIVERDRARAIGLAIAEARPGDTVLVAGKGHETYQEVAGRRLSFDDAECARRWLEARA